MPINPKQRAFINEYMNNGHNASKAYKKAYPDCKSGYDRNGHKLLRNTEIKGEIDRRMTKIQEKTEITREKQHSRLNLLYDMAIEQRNVQAARGVISEQNDMLGYKQDKAPNADKAQAVAKSMAEQDIAIAEEVARILTERAARAGAGPVLSKKHA